VVGTVLLVLDVGVGRRVGLIGAAGTLALVLVAACVPFFFGHGRGESRSPDATRGDRPEDHVATEPRSG